MWTKKGKFNPGTESRISGLSAAKAGAASAIAMKLAIAIRRVMRMVVPPLRRTDMLAGDQQTIAEIGRNDKLICAPLDKARTTIDIARRRVLGRSRRPGRDDIRVLRQGREGSHGAISKHSR